MVGKGGCLGVLFNNGDIKGCEVGVSCCALKRFLVRRLRVVRE